MITTITILGVDYISYASVAEADAVLLIDLVRRASWDALTNSDKEIYLIAATKKINTLQFVAQKTDVAQANEWPRTGVVTSYGLQVADNEVPTEVQDATILLAGTLITTPESTQQDDSNRRRVRAGSAEVEYFKPIKPVNTIAYLDKDAFHLLNKAGLLQYSSGSEVGACASGTDTASYFEDSYGISRGYS
jgi:hypothetical protein